MNIYVANINYTAKSENLKQLFGEFGEVSSCTILKDKQTGRSRGFGFIEMPNDNEAIKAIQELNGFEFEERSLVVKRANDKKN